jgi:hypothetical protein
MVASKPSAEHAATTDEPVGIVISRGSRVEPAPIFRLFVYGPYPDDELADSGTKAA